MCHFLPGGAPARVVGSCLVKASCIRQSNTLGKEHSANLANNMSWSSSLDVSPSLSATLQVFGVKVYTLWIDANSPRVFEGETTPPFPFTA